MRLGQRWGNELSGEQMAVSVRVPRKRGSLAHGLSNIEALNLMGESKRKNKRERERKGRGRREKAQRRYREKHTGS